MAERWRRQRYCLCTLHDHLGQDGRFQPQRSEFGCGLGVPSVWAGGIQGYVRRNLDEFEDMKAVIARGWKQIPIVRWAFREDDINVFASILAYQMNDRTRNDMSCNETC